VDLRIGLEAVAKKNPIIAPAGNLTPVVQREFITYDWIYIIITCLK